jgi:hypothetical protein
MPRIEGESAHTPAPSPDDNASGAHLQAAQDAAANLLEEAKRRAAAASHDLYLKINLHNSIPQSKQADRAAAALEVETARQQVAEANKDVTELEAAFSHAKAAAIAARLDGKPGRNIRGLAGAKAKPTQGNQTLKSRYDALNQKWDSFEAQLQHFLLPHTVCVKWRSELLGLDPIEYIHWLGLVKTKDGWRICAATTMCGNPDEEYPSWIPITERTADVRIEAVSHARDLREAVVQAAEEYGRKLDEAIKSLDSLIATGRQG